MFRQHDRDSKRFGSGIQRRFLVYGLLTALLGALPAMGGGLAAARWQFATPAGIFVVHPATGEIALQGATPGSPAIVIVNLDKLPPPADTTVTLNGVPLVHAFGSPTGPFTVDPAGPQPIVATGGFIQLVVASASAGVQRQIDLPCPSDVAMTSTPLIGSSLAGHSSVQLGFASNIFLNPSNPPIPALAGGPFPTATLLGYDPITGSIPFPFGPLGVALVGSGQLGVTVPISAPATTSQYLMDIRWPGFWQPDGETGAFCGLAKRWTYLSSEPGAPVGQDEIVPVVLKLSGIGTIFTSELTLANTGGTAADLTLTYTSQPSIAAGTTPSGWSVAQRVEAGQQLAILDVIAFLRDRGVPVAAEDVGTLRVSYTGTSASPTVFAQARTTSPSGIGRAGVGYGAPSTASLGASKVAVYGLRQNVTDRSNMALLNAGQSGPATFRVTLISGDPGDTRSVALADVTLQSGEWRQLNGVLGQAGMTNGYATVERVSGTAPFVAYGVINDNGTSDGSFIQMSAVGLPAEPLVVPAVVETPVFDTELTLTNPGTTDLVATLSYVESLSAGGVPATPVTVTLLPGEQRIVPRVIDFLRTQNAGIGAAGTSHAGSLSLTFTPIGALGAGWAGARVTTAAVGGGRYGVSYAGVPLSATAATEAFVTGLRQDGATRSNLALVNVGRTGLPVTLSYEVYDGITMQKAGQSTITLPPGGWFQKNQVLADFGVSNGYVRVVKVSGDDAFIAYGVINDGGPVTPGTNDGSVVRMAGAH